jgi:hypothetical protein
LKLYVYALVDRKLRAVTLHRRRIESVPAAGLFALAARATRTPAVSERALREQHDIVVRLAARADAILPARFGALVERGDLDAIVSSRAALFGKALNLVRGREQMTLRLVGTDVEEEHPRPRRSGGGPGALYLEARRAAAGYPLPPAVERIGRAMRPLVAAERAEPGRGAVRAVVYHLIPRGTGAAYRRALAAAVGEARPYTIELTGPWPPFAFAPELEG